MSSRVQKGGPIFRPVAKPRGRSTNASRQSSVADSRSSVAPIGQVDASSSSQVPSDTSINEMLPPTIVPPPGRETSPGPDPNRLRAPPSFAASHTSRVIPSSSTTAAPSLSTVAESYSHNTKPSTQAKAIVSPTRSAPVLLTVGQTRSFPIPIENPTAVEVITPSSHQTKTSGQSISQPAVDRVPMGPPPDQFEGFGKESEISSAADPPGPEPSTSEVPTVVLNHQSTVKPPPKRKPGRKKKAEAEVSAADGKAKKPRKSSRPKKPSTSSPKPQEAVTDDNAETSDEPEGPKTTKRKRRSSSVSQKPRKPRGSSHPVLDPEADPGEELDPTVITMADLCSDTGQGRISSKAVQIQSNHAAWKTSNRERRSRMKLLMESKKYGRKDDGEEGETAPSKDPVPETVDPENAVEVISYGSQAGSPVPSEGPADEDETGQGFDYSEAVATSRFNVQVRIGPNGETIVDEESLYVDRNDESENLNYVHIEESDTTKFVNSATYGKKFRGSRWTAEETELFFDALSQFGENYELISFILPGRDRKACKNKFKAEDKRDSDRINHCLDNRTPYDISTLSRMTGKDFSGPTPEIRAPEALTLETIELPETSTSKHRVRKKSSTPRSKNDGVEVLGDVSMFDKDDDTDKE